MPMIMLDAPPCRKWKSWRFLTVSVVLHALLLGAVLEFWKGPEIRSYSPENSISVRLVASGVPEERSEGEDVAAQRIGPAPVKEMEKSKTATPQPRKALRKKQSSPAKRRMDPKEGPSSPQKPIAENMVALGEKASSSNLGATVERRIGEGGAPSFARFVPPEYPHQARARNIEGRALLRVLVSAEGRAREIEVLESSHPAFTSAARKSVQRSRYHPLKIQGRAEDAWVLIPFQFKLK